MVIRNWRNAALLSLLLGTGGRVEAQTAPAKAQNISVTAQEQAEWTARLNGVKEKDWRAAIGEVSSMAGLPPGKVIGLLRELWPVLTVSVVKSEILQILTRADHPDTLRVLALAAKDKSGHAASENDFMFEANVALLLPYNNPTADTLARLQTFADRSLDDAHAERLREIAAKIADAPPEYLFGVGHIFRTTHNAILREQAANAGVFAALDKRLMAPNANADAQEAILQSLENFEWPDAMLQRVILPVAANAPDDYTRATAFGMLARAGYESAYDVLKRQIIQEAQNPDAAKKAAKVGWPLMRAVPAFGRADIIPALIGIIAADNTRDTIRYVGADGLYALTGVNYNISHDGNWWRLWWERNHDKLPLDTRSLSIPDFPHSAAYHPPLARDILLDRNRYRQECLDKVMADAQKGTAQGFIDATPLAALHDPTLIPTLIGLIASDNTYNTVYFIGYFVLGDLTGVTYDSTHDGNWWKLWYAEHRAELPAEVRGLPIPDLPHTPAYQPPLSMELHQNPAALRDRLLSDLKDAIAKQGMTLEFVRLDALTHLKDPAAIKPLIALLPANADAPHDKELMAQLSGNGISVLTGAGTDAVHDRTWWQQWWMERHADVEQKIAAFHPQPSYVALKYTPNKSRRESPFVMDAGYNPRVGVVGGVAGRQAEPEPEDVRDVSSQLITLNDDAQRTYRLVGLKAGQAAPAGGYKLLVVLPGGDGGDGFRWFARRLKKYALPADMLIAQIIAPKWNDWQAQNLVWPTRINPFYAMKFPTEQLIEDVVADTAKRARMDPRQVYALAWSSSGPAVYTALASPRSSLRGAFVAMSIFRATGLPDASLLKGKRFFLYHSPQDFIKIGQAREAETFLRGQGAAVQFREYAGGHGWTGDTYGDVRAGLDWLTQSDKKP